MVLHSLPARPLCLCLRSVAIRRWLAQRPEAAAQLFGAQRLPSLLQYDPYSRLLERHPEDGVPQGGEEGASLPACMRQPISLCASLVPPLTVAPACLAPLPPTWQAHWWSLPLAPPTPPPRCCATASEMPAAPSRMQVGVGLG